LYKLLKIWRKKQILEKILKGDFAAFPLLFGFVGTCTPTQQRESKEAVDG
jgi:hypothetical protein